jgi:hypothetical protein
LLDHSEKWKVKDREAPPVRRAFLKLDDDEGDELVAKKNKRRPDGTKKQKKQAEADTSQTYL